MDFNPNVPDQPAPNFTYLARPTYFQPKGSQAGEYALSGAGKAIAEGFTGVDNAIKEHLSSTLHDQVGKEQDSFSTALNTYRNATGQLPDQQRQQAQQQNLLMPNTDQGSQPTAIKTGLDSANKLQGALGAGKISETYYFGQLNSIAKNLRSQFPGYRDYIDQEMSRISGVNPANAYMRSIIEDVNKNTTSATAIHNKIIEAGISLWKEGNLNYQDLDNYMNGRIDTPTFMKKVTDIQADSAKWKKDKAQAEATDAQLTAAGKKGDFVYKPVIQDYVSNLWNHQRESIFTAGGIHSDKDLFNLYSSVANGTRNINPQTWDQWNMQMSSARTSMFNQAMSQFTSHDPSNPNGLTIAQKLPGGIEELKKLVNDQLDTVFGPIHQAIADKDLGGTLYLQRQDQAMKQADEWQLHNDPVFGQTARKLDVLKGYGPAVEGILVNDLLKPDMQSAISGMIMNFATGQIMPKNGNQPYTYDQAFQNYKNLPNATPEGFNKLLQSVNYISDTRLPTQMRLQWARAAFDPSNMNMLVAGFKSDADRRTAFNTFTSPTVSKAIAALNDPTTTANYKQWAERSFVNQIVSPQLEELRNITAGSHPGVKIGWDFEHSQIVLNDTRKATYPEQTWDFKREDAFMQHQIDTLNLGFNNLRHVEEATGGDVNAFLLSVLQHSGVDTTKMDMPHKLLDAMSVKKPVKSAE